MILSSIVTIKKSLCGLNTKALQAANGLWAVIQRILSGWILS